MINTDVTDKKKMKLKSSARTKESIGTLARESADFNNLLSPILMPSLLKAKFPDEDGQRLRKLQVALSVEPAWSNRCSHWQEAFGR